METARHRSPGSGSNRLLERLAAARMTPSRRAEAVTADVSERSGRWSRRANRVVSAWRAIGGRLVVEGGMLRFEPHGMERALGEAAWSISTAEIEAISVAPVRIS